MKFRIKRSACYFLVLLVLSIICSTNTSGQLRSDRILKAGYNPFYPSEYKIFSFHLELEKLKKNKSNRTVGYGISQLRIVDYSDSLTINNTYSGTQNITYIFYKISYYPFQRLLKNKPFNGLMLSLNPCIFYQDYEIHPDNYGFGVLFGIGYQYLIKRRVSLGVEGNLGLLSIVNLPTKRNSLTPGIYYTAKIEFLLKNKSQ